MAIVYLKTQDDKEFTMTVEVASQSELIASLSDNNGNILTQKSFDISSFEDNKFTRINFDKNMSYEELIGKANEANAVSKAELGDAIKMNNELQKDNLNDPELDNDNGMDMN